MKIKNRNLIELIIQSVIWIMLFIPGIFLQTSWIGSGNFYSGHTHVPELDKNISFFRKVMDVISPIHNVYGWVIILFIGACIAIFVIQFLSKGKNSNMIVTIFAPIIEMILFLIYGCLIYNDYNGKESWKTWYDYEPSALFYIELALLLTLFLITAIGYFKAKKGNIIEEVTTKKQSTMISNADELKKYKDLLDSGAITQAEFEEKKKQLLK